MEFMHARTLLEFVKGRNDLTLLYSVCYIDEDNDIVLSHKSEDELEGRYKLLHTTGFTISSFNVFLLYALWSLAYVHYYHMVSLLYSCSY